MTPSIRIALEDLGLKGLVVLYPGTKRFPIAKYVEAAPLQSIVNGDPLFGSK